MGWILSRDAAAHFDEFPHLAAYVSDFRIALDQVGAVNSMLAGAAHEDSTHAVSVLRQLKKICRVSIIGPMNWNYLPHELSAGVLGVIDIVLHRKPGGRLLTEGVYDFPRVSLHWILGSTSAMWLGDITVGEDGLATDADLVTPAADEASLKVLRLGVIPTLKSLLLHPAFTPLIRSLKNLDFSGNPGEHILFGFAICFPCAQTLERLDFGLSGTIGLPSLDNALPSQFPNLRELALNFFPIEPEEISTDWVLPALLADLLPRFVAPLLVQVHLHLLIHLVPNRMAYALPSSSQSLDSILERRLIAGTKVSITPNFCLFHKDRRDSANPEQLIATNFEAFAVAFRDGLPKSVAKGLRILQWDGMDEPFF
ncbi:hypothetical protein C8F01DRAFT_1188928 [Mycena amicta]|nr:hypothetical protein C8F01DRAFT_1188928 [Mycena amicta]